MVQLATSLLVAALALAPAIAAPARHIRQFDDSLEVREPISGSEFEKRHFTEAEELAIRALVQELDARDPAIPFAAIGKALNWAGTIGTLASLPAMFRSMKKQTRDFVEEDLAYREYTEGFEAREFDEYITRSYFDDDDFEARELDELD